MWFKEENELLTIKMGKKYGYSNSKRRKMNAQ